MRMPLGKKAEEGMGGRTHTSSTLRVSVAPSVVGGYASCKLARCSVPSTFSSSSSTVCVPFPLAWLRVDRDEDRRECCESKSSRCTLQRCGWLRTSSRNDGEGGREGSTATFSVRGESDVDIVLAVVAVVAASAGETLGSVRSGARSARYGKS